MTQRADSHENFRPVFIVGFPRSGTTLLAAMLSRHSQIAVPPETRFLEEVLDGVQERAWMLSRLIANRRCRDLGLDMERVTAAFAERPATYSWLFRLLLETFAAKAGKMIVAEKSPIHLLHLPTLARWYPDARFLLIVRDGRDCVLSMLNVPWAHNNVIRHSAEWRRRMSRTRGLLQAYPYNLHVIKYEDLLRTPTDELAGVMTFLALPLEESQLQASPDSAVVPDWEQGWKGKVLELPDPSRIEAWKREADSKTVTKIESVMHKELIAWGYHVESKSFSLGIALLGDLYASDIFKRLWPRIRNSRLNQTQKRRRQAHERVS